MVMDGFRLLDPYTIIYGSARFHYSQALLPGMYPGNGRTPPCTCPVEWAQAELLARVLS